MAQIVKGTIGDQPVELNNAASESTLAAMLAIAKKDNALLTELAKKAGVDAETIKKATASMNQQAAGAAKAGQGLGALAPKANILGNFITDMGASAVATAKNLTAFADQLMDGTAKASDFFAAFKDLPLLLGTVAAVFEKALKYQERNLEVYQQISKAGVGLAGSLSSVRTSAASMYLTMDEYAEVMTQNAEVMNRLGGSAAVGHKAFDEINKQLIRGKLGTELLNLGYTFKDVNNMLGNYLRVSGDGIRVGKNVADEQLRLANAAGQYGKELDFLARLTGESREAKEAEMRQEMMEASWQMKLAKMAPEEKEKAMAAMQNALASGGKGAADAIKAQVMGFAAPASKEGQAFVANFQESNKVLQGWTSMIYNKSIPVEKARQKIHEDQSKVISANMRALDSIEPVIYGMGQGFGEAEKGIMDIVKITNSWRAQGIKNADQITKVIKEQEKLTAENKDAAAQATANSIAMKNLSELINIALAPVMNQLATYGTEVVKEFITFTKKVDFDKVGKAIASMMAAVVDYTKYLFDPAGREKIANDIKNLFKEILIELKLALAPGYDEDDAKKERLKMALNDKIIKAKADEALLLQQSEQLKANIEAKKIQGENESTSKRLADEIKKVNDDKKLSDEEKKQRLEKLEEEKKSIDKQISMAKNVDNLDKAKAEQIKIYNEYVAMNKRHQMAVDEYNAKIVGDPKYRRVWEATKKREGITDDNYTSSYEPKRASGSLGATGRLIENFGKGTSAVLHGNEGVITEAQLANLASGAIDTGAAGAQEKLANAVLALNKQQATTNQILERIADYTKRSSDTQGRWGNAFTRV